MNVYGYLAAISAAASWAVASIAISRLLAHGRVTPAAANLFKNGLAAAFFFALALVLGGRWPVGAAWGWLFLSGLLGFAVSDTLYFAAFRRCGVQTAATVLLLNVPVASLLAVPIVGERLQDAVLPYMAIVLAGVVLVILDSRTGTDPSEPGGQGRFLIGVLFAMLAAFSLGLALPLGRHRFGDVGVWPGSFIRLAGGAFGAVPMAMLSGLRAGSRPSTEVGRLVEPLFRAPGPTSVWGRTALFGVGVAILGLIPYHYALRELPSGIASILFATTPLFTLPLSLLVRQRVGLVAALGSAVGFVGVAGILALESGIASTNPPPVDQLERVEPKVIPLSVDAPEGARFPTFVAGAERVRRADRAPLLPPMLAVVDREGPAREGENGTRARLLLLGFDEFGGPGVQSVLEELGDAPPTTRLFVHFADTARAARLSSGALVFAHLETLEPDSLAAGVKVSIADSGPPGRDLGWLHTDLSVVDHGFVTLVPGDPGANVMAVWLDDRPPPGGGERSGAELRARTIKPSGELGEELLLDDRVVDSSPTGGVRFADGGIAVAYRDLSADDVVDIAIVRRTPDGRWLQPSIVHGDGWQFSGPLVNGPAVAADEEWLAVAWYLQLPTGEPALRVAFSRDQGRTFGAPRTLRTGATKGQVALAAMGKGIFALVHDAPPPEGAEPGALESWQVAFVAEGSEPTAFVRLGALLGRASGRLDLVAGPPGYAFAAWTGPNGLQAARITVGELPGPPTVR